MAYINLCNRNVDVEANENKVIFSKKEISLSKQNNGGSGHHHKGNRISDMRKNITAEDCYMQISEAAYYIAERRGFESGHEIDDWLLAEAEIKKRLQETLK